MPEVPKPETEVGDGLVGEGTEDTPQHATPDVSEPVNRTGCSNVAWLGLLGLPPLIIIPLLLLRRRKA